MEFYEIFFSKKRKIKTAKIGDLTKRGSQAWGWMGHVR
jgi:hypothetical protein